MHVSFSLCAVLIIISMDGPTDLFLMCIKYTKISFTMIYNTTKNKTTTKMEKKKFSPFQSFLKRKKKEKKKPHSDVPRKNKTKTNS